MAGLNFGAGIDTREWNRDIENMRRDILDFSNNTLGELSQKLKQIFSSDTFDAENLEYAIGGITKGWADMGTVGEEQFEKLNKLMADVMDKQFELSENPPQDPLSLGVAEYDLKKAQDSLVRFVESVRTSNSDIIDFKKTLQESIKKNFFSDTGEVMIADLKRARDEARKVYQDLVKDRDKVARELDKMPSSGAKNELTSEFNKINREVAKSKVAMEQYGKVYDQVQGQGTALYTRINQLRVSMQQLDTTTAEGAKRYMELSKELTDVQIKIRQLNQQTSVMSRGGVGIQAFAGGFRALSGTMTTATGLMTLFNAESENMEKQMVRLQSLMSVSIGVEQLMNTTRRDGALMTSISVLQIRARARAEALATKETIRATIAQRAYNAVANMNPYVLLATTLISVAGAFVLFSRKNKEAQEAQEELNKRTIELTTEGLAPQLIKFKQLQTAWNDLGGDLSKQTKFVKANKDEFKELGIAVNDVNTASNLFTTNSDAFIQSLMLRAKASAAAKIAEEKYEEIIRDRLKVEQDIADQEAKGYKMHPDLQKGLDENIKLLEENDIKIIDSRQKAGDKLLKMEQDYINQANDIIKKLGIEPAKDGAKIRVKTLEEELKEKHKLWEDYYKTIDMMGLDNANKIFGDDINVDSNFLEYVRGLRDELKELARLGDITKEQRNALILYDDTIADLTNRESPFEKQVKEIRDNASQIDVLIDRLEYLRDTQDSLGDSLPDLMVKAEIERMIKDAEAERKAIYDNLTQESKDFEELVKQIEIDRQNALNEAVTESMRDTANAIADKKIQDAYIEHLKKIYPELDKVLTDINSLTRQKLREYRAIIVQILEGTDDIAKKTELAKIIDKIDFELSKLDANPLHRIAEGFKAIKENADDLDLGEALGNIGSGISEVAGAFRGSISDIEGMADDLGISLDNSFGDVLDKLGDTLEGIEKMGEGVQDIAMGIATGNPIAVITGTVKAIGGLVKAVSSWFNSDRRKERQTQRILKQLRELESAYRDLGHAIDVALGEDKLKNQMQLIGNLQKQQVKLTEAINKEREKKKSDNDRIEEWQEQIKDIQREIENLHISIRDELLGTDVKSFADKLANALIDAFKAGEDAADSLNKSVDELFENMVRQALSMRMQKELNRIFDDMYDDFAPSWDVFGGWTQGGLTQAQIDDYKRQIEGIANINSEWLEMMEDMLGFGDNGKIDSLKGALQGMSEETAGVLAGQFNAIRIDTSTIVTMMQRGEDRFLQALGLLAGIKDDTANLHQMRLDISDMNSKMSDNDLRSSGL